MEEYPATNQTANQPTTPFADYQAVLELVDDALQTLTTEKIQDFAELKAIEKLYKNAKALHADMPQTAGRDIATQKLLRIHQIIETTRHNLRVAEHNEKANFLVNLLHRAELELEENNTEQAMKIYGQMKDVFAHLPETSKLDTAKHNNLQRQLQQLYQKIMFAREIEQDVRLSKVLFRLEKLINMCRKTAETNKSTAERLYLDIVQVYDHLPEDATDRKIILKEKLLSLRKYLDGEQEPAAEEHKMSTDLIAALHAADKLKEQQSFKELINSLSNLYDHKEMHNLKAATEHYEQARRHFFALEGSEKEKKYMHKLMCKARDSLLLLTEIEKLQSMKEQSAASVQLASLRRMALEYNSVYPEDSKFTDSVYQKCKLVGDVLGE